MKFIFAGVVIITIGGVVALAVSKPSEAFSFPVEDGGSNIHYECETLGSARKTADNAREAHQFFEVEFKAAIEKFAERFGALMNQPNTAANRAAMAETNVWGKELRREVVRRVASTYGCRVPGES